LKSIIDGFSEVLPASDVPFRGLHRRVAEKKLNLFEFASGLMAETGASATKIVGCKVVNADSLGVSPHGIPDYVGCHSFALPSPILRNSSEHLAFRHSSVMEPSIYEAFTPGWHGDRSQSSSLPNHIYDYPVAFPQLQLIQLQLHGFRASQTATEQQPDHCCISSAARGALGNGIQ
jgi:hypothetical protein